MKILISLIACFVASTTFAGETLISKGTGFDKEGKEKKFTYERYINKEGDTTTHRAVYKDMDGEVLTEETMTEKNGKLVQYDMQQKQIKQHAWIVVKEDGKKIEYNLKKYRKNNYPITAKMKKNFVVGLQIVDLIRDNWDSLMKDKDVEFHLGVWHRQETIGFELSKDSSDDKSVTIKMSPSSMFIRAVVNPLYFTLDKASKKLIKYKGRTTPKEKLGRDYQDFDGLVVYEDVGGGAKAPDKKEKSKKPAKKSKKK